MKGNTEIAVKPEEGVQKTRTKTMYVMYTCLIARARETERTGRSYREIYQTV